MPKPKIYTWPSVSLQTPAPQLPLEVLSEELPENAQTLLLGTDGTGLDNWDGHAINCMVLGVRLGGGRGVYSRAFQLNFYDRVEIPCAPYDTVRIFLIRDDVATAAAAKTTAQLSFGASSGPPNPNRSRVAYLPQALAGGQFYQVPNGAQRVISPTADAGFFWRSFLGPGVVDVTTGIAANTWLDVAGPVAVSPNPISVVWEIGL